MKSIFKRKINENKIQISTRILDKVAIPYFEYKHNENSKNNYVQFFILLYKYITNFIFFAK